MRSGAAGTGAASGAVGAAVAASEVEAGEDVESEVTRVEPGEIASVAELVAAHREIERVLAEPEGELARLAERGDELGEAALGAEFREFCVSWEHRLGSLRRTGRLLTEQVRRVRDGERAELLEELAASRQPQARDLSWSGVLWDAAGGDR